MTEIENQARWRSFVKGVTWRILATSTTILLSYWITGQINTAIKIGPIDFVTKLCVYYFYERFWLLPSVQLWKNKGIMKMWGWKAIALSMTIMTTFYVTGNLDAAFKVGPADFFAKLFLYYAHDLIWDTVPYGKSLVKVDEKKSE